MVHVRDTLRFAARQSRRAAAGVSDSVRAASSSSRFGWLDVWSRTEPRYRRRAITLLLINGLLFAGLGGFTYWLRTGKYIPFFSPDYWEIVWRTFDPTPHQQITLVDFLTYPINIQQAPAHVIVLGLLMASIVSIPILVAMLYRLPAALIFLVIVAFVGVLPWLAMTLLLSCALTALKPLRFSFRYATALIALIPAVVYFFTATRNPTLVASQPKPMDWPMLYAPWALAILGSCVLMGLVLWLARVVNYRPGVIAPLLAVMFATPVVVFEAKVGRDELYYRVLERQCGPNSATVFRDQDARAVIHEIAERVYEHAEKPGRSVAEIEEEIKHLWQYELDPMKVADRAITIFAQQQDDVVQACDKFRADFPRSRYVPNVLYIKGRAIDMRVDVEAFRRDAVVHFYDDFPSPNSAPTWALIAAGDWPPSPVTAIALYRLAQLEARAGRIDAARERLRRLEAEFGRPVTTAPAPSAPLAKPDPTGTLGIRIREVVLAGRRFAWLLERYWDPPYANAPLVEMLRMDPRHRLYTRNLEELLEKYPNARLRDYVELQLVLHANERSASLRIAALEAFVREHADDASGALGEAYYRLGEAYVNDRRDTDAVRAFQAVVDRCPDSPWVEDAQIRLGQLAPMKRTSRDDRGRPAHAA